MKLKLILFFSCLLKKGLAARIRAWALKPRVKPKGVMAESSPERETVAEKISDDGHGTGLSVDGIARAIAKYERDEVDKGIEAAALGPPGPPIDIFAGSRPPPVPLQSAPSLPPKPSSPPPPPPKFSIRASPQRKNPFSRFMGTRVAAESPPREDEDADTRRTHPAENIRTLLTEYRAKFKVCSAAHNLTATSYNKTHKAFTITIMIISFIGSLLNNIFDKFNITLGLIINNIIYGISGILTGIAAGQNFGKLAEKHAQLRDQYISMIASIDGVLAVDADMEAGRGTVDFVEVLKRIEDMRDNIKKGAVQIPAWVQERLSKQEFWKGNTPPPEVLAAELF